jgi:hypothetical protein
MNPSHVGMDDAVVIARPERSYCNELNSPVCEVPACTTAA